MPPSHQRAVSQLGVAEHLECANHQGAYLPGVCSVWHTRPNRPARLDTSSPELPVSFGPADRVVFSLARDPNTTSLTRGSKTASDTRARVIVINAPRRTAGSSRKGRHMPIAMPNALHG